MHPSRYPINASQVGLVGTLLSDITLAWFAPFLEKELPLLNNIEEFVSKFKHVLEMPVVLRILTNKIQRLCQGDRLASAYASDFRILVVDIS